VANHKSAIKRARQNEKRKLRNQGSRAAVKTSVKTALAEILKASTLDIALKALHAGEKALQKAASKSVIPKKRAQRKTSRLAKILTTRFRGSAAVESSQASLTQTAQLKA
jgi:small subunit ribosomal protein S20